LALQSVAAGSPLRRAKPLEAVRPMSPPTGATPIASGSTSEHSEHLASTLSVRCTRHALGYLLQNPAPRGLHQKPPTDAPKRSSRALVPFTSRTKYDPWPLADSATDPRTRRRSCLPLADDPPMKSHGPPAYEVTGSDLRRSYQLRLRGASGLSQPLDALLHPKPSRPWFMPVTLMGFPPSEAFPRR
jgi:hypothetical protein